MGGSVAFIFSSASTVAWRAYPSLKRILPLQTPSVSGDEVTITDICPSEVDDNTCFIVSGNQTRGLISKVTIHDKKSILEEIDVEVSLLLTQKGEISV